MSPAQLLIIVIGAAAAAATFVLMRYPQHRREQYRGPAFSVPVSVATAMVVLAFCLALAWAQGEYESGRFSRVSIDQPVAA